MEEALQSPAPQVQQQPLETPPPVATKSSKKTWFTLILGFTITLVIVLGILFFIKNGSTPKPLENEQNASQPVTPTTVPTQSNATLLNYIPNFDNLQLSDLPNFNDVRAVYPYNGNKLIIGVDQIAEYNPNTKELVRIKNSNVLKSVHSAALVGNAIFMTSNRNPTTEYTGPAGRFMQKIDAKTGEVLKTYFKDDPRSLINLYLVDKGGILWLYSEDGAMKFDPNSEQVVNYSDSQLGNPGCKAHGIYIKDGKVKLPFLCNGTNVGIYDDATDTWKLEKFDDSEWSAAINRGLEDVGLSEIPRYWYISNRVGDKYYLFADKGIYTLEKNGLPKFYKQVIVNPSFLYDGENRAKIYVTNNESFALLLGDEVCGPGSECQFRGQLVNLKNGTISDLLKNNSYSKSLSAESYRQFIKEISQSRVTENEQEIILTNSTGKTIAKVNTLNQTIEFSK